MVLFPETWSELVLVP